MEKPRVSVPVTVGLFLVVAVTLLFWIYPLDLSLTRVAYSPGDNHWPFDHTQPWYFLYRFGTLPAILLSVLAALGLGASFWKERWAAWRWPCLYVVLLLALGPGLVINVLAKGLMGRPRPEEVTAFSGTWHYLKPFQMGIPGKGRSFLCGHCSMGFLFLCLFFLLTGWTRWLGLVFGIVFGLALAVARVAQGAHFPSDGLLCGAVMFTLAAALSPLARRRPGARFQPLAPWKAISLGLGLALLLVLGFLFSTPVYEDRVCVWLPASRMHPAQNATQRIFPWKNPGQDRVFFLDASPGHIHLQFRDQAEPIVVASTVNGFGFPGAKSLLEEKDLDPAPDQPLVQTDLLHHLRGAFVEVHAHFQVYLPLHPSSGLRLILRSKGSDILISGQGLQQPVCLTSWSPVQDLPPAFHASKNGSLCLPGKGPLLDLELDSNRVVWQ